DTASAEVTTTNFVPGDEVGLDFSSATFADKNVGDVKTVTVYGIYLTGSAKDKYNLLNETATAEASITPKPLSIDAVAATKEYDGTTASTGTPTAAGLVGGDSIDATQTYDTAIIGTGKTLTVVGYAVTDGNSGKNYSVSTGTNDFGVITAKNLTITGAVADSKVYDRSLDATVTFTAANLVGVVGSEGVAIDSADYLAFFLTPAADTGKDVTVSGVKLSGLDAGNYTVSQPTGLKASITPKELTITGAVADGKVYDASTDATVTFTGAGLVGILFPDAVTIDSSAYAADFATPGVDIDKDVTVTGVALGGAAAGNYTVEQPTGLKADITAKNLTITGAVAENKTYDASTDATVTFTGASLEGIESGDGVGIDDSAYSASFDSAAWGVGKDVAVLGVKLSGVSKANYTVSQPTGLKANIDKRPITVTAGPDQKDYDGTTSSTVVPTVTDGSLVLGQTGTWVQVFDNPNVGDMKALKPSGTIKDAAEADMTSNYDITFDDGQGIIDPRPIDVTADDQLKTYGSVDPTLTYTITAGSLVGSDTFSGSPKRVAGETVGEYMIDQGTLSLSDNYGLGFGSGTLTIQQRPITVTAVTDIKVYDGTTSSTVLPHLSIGTPLATGDAGTWSQVFSQSHVGFDVQLEPSGIIKNLADVDVTNQYDISFDSVYDGEITARPITLTAKTDTRVYDGTTTSSVAPEVTSGSLVAGDVGTWKQTFDTPDVGTDKTLSPDGRIKNAAD
ncbi:MAG: YDG domain-containing protein, partial [Actinomycetes bacterium]